MVPEHLIIEEQQRRERRREWQPEPLYAPSPVPRRRPEPDAPSRDNRPKSGGNVIIIDISDYTEI